MLTPTQEQWLDQHGKVVTLSGYRHVLKVDSYDAISPYPHTVLRVHAVPLSAKTRYYKTIKAQLGDDWSTDVLASSSEVTTDVMRQVGMI